MVYEDVLGENEIRVLLAVARGLGRGADGRAASAGAAIASGSIDTPGGPALVWYVVWDDQRSADRFVRTAGPTLKQTSRQGYRAEFGPVAVAGRPRCGTCWRRQGGGRWGRLPEVGGAWSP